jgi:hypothetical protein
MSNARDLADSAQIINILDTGGNLNNFATTFTLPSTDGANGQVIATNGTGTLSFVDGSDPNALTSSNIGVDVQAYDANLSSFVTTFTLPVADGTAGQVISTDGAGNLVFISGTAVIDGGSP